MKKIDKAFSIKNGITDSMTKEEIIKQLCPVYFGLDDSLDYCYGFNSYCCTACWNEEIEEDGE